MCAVTTALNEGGIRISPRRTRLITRTLLAALIVADGRDLGRAVPQGPRRQPAAAACGHAPEPDKVAAAHRLAWNAVRAKRSAWLHYFLVERRLDRQGAAAAHACPNPDTGTLAVEQLLAQDRRSAPPPSRWRRFPPGLRERCRRRRGRQRSRPPRRPAHGRRRDSLAGAARREGHQPPRIWRRSARSSGRWTRPRGSRRSSYCMAASCCIGTGPGARERQQLGECRS